MHACQGFLEDAKFVAVKLQKRLKEEMKLKTESELKASHIESSARHANDLLDQAKKSFEEEKAALIKRAEKAEEQLKTMKEEHLTLVKKINEMLTAIFDMYS